MELIRESRIDRQPNMLLIQDCQRAMKSIARIVIYPRSILPIRCSFPRIRLSCSRSRRMDELLFQAELTLERAIEVRFLEQRPDSCREIIFRAGGRESGKQCD
jgi:hypothetical protein